MSQTVSVGRDAKDQAFLNEFQRIIEACLRIRAHARQLLQCSDAIALISVNAGISASNANHNKGVFSALAQETKEVAQQITLTVQRVQEVSFELVSGSSPGIIRYRSVIKLNEALAMLSGPSREAMLETLTTVYDELKMVFRRLDEEIFLLKTQHQTILAQLEKSEAIKVYFKIEVSRSGAQGTYLDSIQGELAVLNKAISETAFGITDLLQAYDQHYQTLRQLMKTVRTLR
jgi:hypothetical protein